MVHRDIAVQAEEVGRGSRGGGDGARRHFRNQPRANVNSERTATGAEYSVDYEPVADSGGLLGPKVFMALECNLE